VLGKPYFSGEELIIIVISSPEKLQLREGTVEIHLQNISTNWPIINGLFQFAWRNLVWGITLETHQLRFYHLRGEDLLSSLVPYLERDRETGVLDKAARHVYDEVIGSIGGARSVVIVRQGDGRVTILYDEVTDAHDDLLKTAQTLSEASIDFAITYQEFVTPVRDELATA
jgi:hypothetical protein